MNVVAILQARMSSSRLPGKVLMPLMGRPMLARQIERTSRSKAIDRLVVATSDSKDDDAIEDLCRRLPVDCHRGAIDDVLDRVYQAAARFGADHVVRLTGDCPLADPAVIDGVIGRHLETRVDYTSNVHPPTWPDGLDVEVVGFRCLEDAWRSARQPSDREHVTSYIAGRPERYRCGNVEWEQNHAHLRWTVDEQPDLELVRRIFDALYPTKPEFDTADILALIEAHPEIAEINAGINRNEGYSASLMAESDSKAQ